MHLSKHMFFEHLLLPSSEFHILIPCIDIHWYFMVLHILVLGCYSVTYNVYYPKWPYSLPGQWLEQNKPIFGYHLGLLSPTRTSDHVSGFIATSAIIRLAFQTNFQIYGAPLSGVNSNETDHKIRQIADGTTGDGSPQMRTKLFIWFQPS